MIAIEPTAEGCLLPVRVQPGARKEGIVGEYNGALKVAVQAPPEAGKANKAVIEVVAKTLGIAKRNIELVKGRSSRSKVLLVRMLAASELAERLGESGS